MRRFVGATVLLIACLGTVQAGQEQARATIRDIAWITGSWTSGSASTVEERWTPAAGGAMLGVSRTIRGDRMAEFEFLRIVERNGGLVYIAQPGGRAPTEFALTKIDAESATFENPVHDFPKMIRYAKRPDGGIEASISAGPGTKPMSWTFKPLGQ